MVAVVKDAQKFRSAGTTALLTLAMLTMGHGVVDAVASSVQPLWPDLQRVFGLGEAGVLVAYVTWALATSFSQLGFGIWGDHEKGRWWLWAGPVLGVLGVCTLGLAATPAGLLLLLVIGGLGVAAFHPVAAVLAGACLAGDHGRAMSNFAMGGFVGQSIGPSYSGLVTTSGGLPALSWDLAWGLPMVVLLAIGLRWSGGMKMKLGGSRMPVRAQLEGRLKTLGLLLGVAVLMMIPGLGIPLALVYAIKGRGGTNAEVGMLQSVFLGGIGLGSLGCALLVRRVRERKVLVVVPMILGTLLLSGAPLFGVVLAAGLLLGVVSPVLIGYGQRVMPDGQRLVSSITMGVAWGVGGIVVAATVALLTKLDAPLMAFPLFALWVWVSSVLCRRPRRWLV